MMQQCLEGPGFVDLCCFEFVTVLLNFIHLFDR